MPTRFRIGLPGGILRVATQEISCVEALLGTLVAHFLRPVRRSREASMTSGATQQCFRPASGSGSTLASQAREHVSRARHGPIRADGRRDTLMAAGISL